MGYTATVTSNEKVTPTVARSLNPNPQPVVVLRFSTSRLRHPETLPIRTLPFRFLLFCCFHPLLDVDG